MTVLVNLSARDKCWSEGLGCSGGIIMFVNERKSEYGNIINYCNEWWTV